MSWRYFFLFGATNRIRTYDPLITNEMLYQLSYSSIGNSSILPLLDFLCKIWLESSVLKLLIP